MLFLDVPQFGRLPEESLVWAITKTEARWARIDLGTKALGDRVAALRCGLDHTLWQAAESAERCRAALKASPGEETVKAGDKDEPVQVLPFDLERAHALYKALLGPVEDMIKGKHLLVVPSGPLTSLPFHVLVTEAPSPRIAPLRKPVRGGMRVGCSSRRQTLGDPPLTLALSPQAGRGNSGGAHWQRSPIIATPRGSGRGSRSRCCRRWRR